MTGSGALSLKALICVTKNQESKRPKGNRGIPLSFLRFAYRLLHVKLNGFPAHYRVTPVTPAHCSASPRSRYIGTSFTYTPATANAVNTARKQAQRTRGRKQAYFFSKQADFFSAFPSFVSALTFLSLSAHRLDHLRRGLGPQSNPLLPSPRLSPHKIGRWEAALS